MIVKRIFLVFGFVLIFSFVSICVSASNLSYDDDGAVLSKSGAIEYSKMFDNNLDTYYKFPNENSNFGFDFDKRYYINAYFIKDTQMYSCSIRLTLDGREVNLNVLNRYKKDGGLYYVLDKPVLANGFHYDTAYNRFYELEFFSDPIINIDHQQSENNILIEYSLFGGNGSAIDYNIYLNDKLVKVTSETTFVFENLEPGTEYNIKVSAKISDGKFVESSLLIKTKPVRFKLIGCSCGGKLRKNDIVVYTFNKDVFKFTKKNIGSFDSYKIDNKKVIINFKNNYETDVNVNFAVIDKDGQALTINKKYKTIKKGEIFMDFKFITDWMGEAVTAISGSTKIILGAGLTLTGLIVGAFFLIGLAKKAVKKSK